MSNSGPVDGNQREDERHCIDRPSMAILRVPIFAVAIIRVPHFQIFLRAPV